MKEIFERLLGLMGEIDAICQANDVEYYLFGGTLIGAMRHKGFIPWDDDVDIIMSRANWEKFLDACKKGLPENRCLSSLDLDSNIAMPVHHYIDTRGTTLYRYHVTNPEITGIMIDIQVMDPVPDGKEAHDNYIEDVLNLQDFTNGMYYVALRNPVHGGQSSEVAKYRKMSESIGKRATIEKIGERSFHYSIGESKYFAQRFGGAPIFYPIEAFGRPRYVPFEKLMLPIPERAADVLTIAYGDWWMIPRGGSTKSSHDFAVRSFTIPSEVILNDFQQRTSASKIQRIAWRKKKLQEKFTMKRFRSATNIDVFWQQKVCMDYEKKAEMFDVIAALRSRSFNELSNFLDEYIRAQCNENYTGSPSINGWKRFYRRNAPLLIDIGDDLIAASILLQIRNCRLNNATKIVKARQTIDREMMGELLHAMEVYNGTMSAISMEAAGEYDPESFESKELYNSFQDNPYLYAIRIKHAAQNGEPLDSVIADCDIGLELFNNNDELMYYKADALLKLGRLEEALSIYDTLSCISDHGVVLTSVKEILEKMDTDDTRIRFLLLKIRRRLGQELTQQETNEILESASCFEKKALLESGCGGDASEVKNASQEAMRALVQDAMDAAREAMILADETAMDLEESPSLEAEKMAAEASAEAEKAVEAAEILEKKFLDGENQGEIDERLTDIQKVRLNLLFELDDICRTNGINYILMSSALYQAVCYHEFVFPNSELSVAMTVPDAKKFADAVKKQNRSDRFLNTMKTNPKYHMFDMRYCDLNTLDFKVLEAGEIDQCGIYIAINIIRTQYRNKAISWLDAILEKGWQNQYFLKDAGVLEHKSDYLISVLRKIYGSKLPQHLYDRFMRNGWNEDRDRVFIKFFQKKRHYVNLQPYYSADEVLFEGRNLKVPGDSNAFLGSWYTNFAKTERRLLQKKTNPYQRIIDAKIPCEEYLSYLKKHNIDRKGIWTYNIDANAKYAKVLYLDRKMKKYWNLLCSIGYEHNLKEKYLPMKEELKALLEKRDFTALGEALKDYDSAFRKREINRDCLRFDAELTEIYNELRNFRKRKMLKRLHSDKVEDVLAYLKQDILNCLYMYIDIAKYGIENENIDVWYNEDENGDLRTILMKYYNSISVYSNSDEYDVGQIVQKIQQLGVATINAKRTLIEAIEPKLSYQYNAEYGYVFRFDSAKMAGCADEIETAKISDMHEIAELICADDDFGAMYNVENLARQLSERMEANFGRSYIIRKEGRIIAHIASYCEFDHISTTSGLVVAKDCQNGVYGFALENYLVNRLWEDGFSVYTFVTKKLRRKLLERTGNTLVGEYGKLTLKRE